VWFFYGIVFEAAQIQTTQMTHWQETKHLPPSRMDPAVSTIVGGASNR